jgi:hypothetical protein
MWIRQVVLYNLVHSMYDFKFWVLWDTCLTVTEMAVFFSLSLSRVRIQGRQRNFHKFLNWKYLLKLVGISKLLQSRTTATTHCEDTDCRLDVSTLLARPHQTAFRTLANDISRCEVDLHVLTW